jgi:hypothetical protein
MTAAAADASVRPIHCEGNLEAMMNIQITGIQSAFEGFGSVFESCRIKKSGISK